MPCRWGEWSACGEESPAAVCVGPLPWRPFGAPQGWALSDGYFVFLDGDFAAVVAAFATNGVIDVPCAAVGADSQCGGYGFVVCSAFSSAGLGLFAFRMCHCSLLFFRDLLQFRGHVSFRQAWCRVKKLCKGREYLPLCQELTRKSLRPSVGEGTV